ncbi:MAG: LysM peptidoglycan-binding domain-containing protein [Acidimicrobiales bacterium]
MTALVHPMPVGRGRRVRPCPPQVAAARRPAATTAAGRPAAAQFRRRRAVASLVAVVLLGGGLALGVPGDVPLTPSGRAPAAGSVSVDAAVPVARLSYVVQPGDTLWDIARALQPSGDVRPLVQRLDAGRGGAPLRAGERLVLPAG